MAESSEVLRREARERLMAFVRRNQWRLTLRVVREVLGPEPPAPDPDRLEAIRRGEIPPQEEGGGDDGR